MLNILKFSFLSEVCFYCHVTILYLFRVHDYVPYTVSIYIANGS